ncbi:MULTISPECIES: bifunctional 4-hydroxy-2-oxoglutarate aldolase/2-dehydro-3-deoxy-phosphogluconate aldolase [unclassified Francisella]|uniref:bifunctional 4-hydroxy-2-oxoglutarate aldolase/2-dehydro-3-deoxy-phosphogluconate aldolase n=1 Tax=unclassified Francisella TaxID=2610885 RepID=UPI002E37C2B1|nr:MULTISPECIES: bifunctional 4-hydroxy-2-oxoglutarate aldolase/2-dehydro-3-deoxy-phosphogluconate aldolase [unclassified Francisella]MED7818493.1 bifunctional 4-hydroxy-2-oxoglutarate aldolase/2-dehydro-3-deoxy-phosphogluconate aldolase [Francisella sp. 19S2-4]MED7829252.1 bifunctional 4-hydroxy-2-oxoglutarate aldolase/2-dehydro-3-deoxy-phosphogluconate aldolase [Francisella sp. 19S2-10]
MPTGELLKNNPLIPVVSADTIEQAESILKKVREKKLNIVEFTLRTPNSLDVIEKVIKSNNDLIIGIGTITNIELFRKARFLEADFYVSPGSSDELLNFAREHNLKYLPGAITPFEIMTAMSYGFNTLKFFPAEAFGGIKVLKNYRSVFPNIRFCATGGINSQNQQEYLDLENVIAIGSSSLI